MLDSEQERPSRKFLLTTTTSKQTEAGSFV